MLEREGRKCREGKVIPLNGPAQVGVEKCASAAECKEKSVEFQSNSSWSNEAGFYLLLSSMQQAYCAEVKGMMLA